MSKLTKEELSKALFPCTPPCDSFGVCDNCCDAKIWRLGHASRDAEVAELKAALEYYAHSYGSDAQGWFGGKRAREVLAKWRTEGEK